MTIRYSTEPVALDHAPGSEYAVVAGSYYDDEPAVWCRILSPGRNRDYRAVIVEPGDRHGKMVFVAAPAGPDRLQELVGHLVLVDLEREKDRVCFGAPAKMALASLRDGVPGSTCRPDLRPCAAGVDSVQEAESRLLADNDVAKLPPEFARAERFDGTFFLDFPGREQKQAIWQIYLDLFEIDRDQKLPPDDSWTGAEIRACCRLAALLDVPLVQAAQNVVPVAMTAAESVERLRTWASGRCLDADQPGIYRREPPTTGSRRKVVRGASNN